MTGEVRVQAWTNPKLVAAELPEARSTYAQQDSFAANAICNRHDLYRRGRPIASIHSSDARALDQLGRRPTWIKVSSRDITGLKHAFLDWESRIRHPDELPAESFSRIVAAEWGGGFLDGMRIHFSDNLNCIIGGKGTGKSTIIESLRYALAAEPAAQEALQQHRGIIDEVFRSGSTIRVLVQCHAPSRTSYLVERGHPGDAVVYRWDEDSQSRGEALPQMRPGDILPDLEVYGQKEILELSRDKEIQLKLLERFVSKDEIRLLKERESETLRQLRDNAEALLGLERNLENAQEQERELGRLQERARQYEQMGFRDRLAERRQYVTEDTTFNRAEEEIRKVEAAVETLATSSPASTTLLSEDQLDSLPHPTLMREVQTALDAINSAVEASVQSARTALASGRDALADIRQRWEPDHAEQLQRYRAILRELQVDAADPDQYIQGEQRIQQLRPQVEAARETVNRREALRASRSQLLADLENVRRDGFQLFNRCAEGLNEQLTGVIQVTLTYQGQGEAFAERLTELRSNARSDQIKRLVQHRGFSPGQFAERVRQGATALEETYQLTHAAAEALCSRASGATLFELEVFDIPASISIALNLGTAEQPNYKETSHLSVGQRCTAILMLILLQNPYPLVVDQPEDDLDNSFVYTDIVQRLRREKERRQFLIATHNANIPVLGDAELIQVLRAERGRLLLEDCPSGSIDDRSLRGPVERILEGGHDAFEMRKAKYGF